MRPAKVEAQRAAVWAEAQTWLRTPWQHRQAVKGAAVDCGRLLIACYAAAGVFRSFEPAPYPADWSLNHHGERMIALAEKYAIEVEADRASLGDTVLFKYGHNFSHGGVVGPQPGLMIHAYRSGPTGAVQYGDFLREEEFRLAEKRFFTPRAWAA